VALAELPLTLLVALFLAVFVLIGIHPALKRAAVAIRKLVQSSAQSKQLFTSLLSDLHTENFAPPPSPHALNDYEIIVLRRLAQAGGKSLSRKQVNAPLLFGEQSLHKTLQSLNRRGLVSVQISTLLGPRFCLTETGLSYAAEQGYMIKIHERKGALI